nr:alkaline phosphatase family protein [Acidithiobacillus ferrooxidans]
MQHWSRRQFLQALGAGSAAGLACHPLSALAAAENSDQIAGLRQHVRHIVVIYQENRSFDHYFGAYRHPRPRPARERLDASRLCGPPHRRHHQYPPAHRNALPASAPERTGRCSLCSDGWTGFQRESARPGVYLMGDDP